MTDQTISCLVVDDEKLARTLLVNYIGKLSSLELVGECKTALEAITILQNRPVDLLFLDIQMPELTGIEFLHTLQARPLVIFTTAYPEYALEGYQLDVVDYLLKPFRFDRFLQAVNKAARRLNFEGEPVSLTTAPAPVSPERAFLLVKANHAVHKIFLDEIRYIEGMKEYVAFHLPEQRIISIQSLKQLEQDLPADQFIRIHKSYIVAIDKVTATDGGHVHLGKQRLPVGGIYKEEVQRRLF
ncbi:MAG: response regulator transcription factor [Lewinella sp.]|nr:response regulator transcription factor [Lewinella sp.]